MKGKASRCYQPLAEGKAGMLGEALFGNVG